MSKTELPDSAPSSQGKAERAPRTLMLVALRPLALVSRRLARVLASSVFVLLAVEFLDELVDGARQASWAMVRADLGLSYTQVGLLLTLPMLFGNAVEPAVNLLGDTRRRRVLILSGGACFALALALVASSRGFWSLLLAFLVFNPASGAFVGLSQATLMDDAPARREQNMARWVFSGSLGIVAGALAVGAAAAAGAGWRACFGAMTLVALIVWLRARRLRFDARASFDDQAQPAQEFRQDERDDVEEGGAQLSFVEGARAALRALRRGEVWRWLVLLEVASVMFDAFHGYLALYFVDVVGAGEARASLAVAVGSIAVLAGDFLLIPLLERVRGLDYLRWSASAMLLLLPAFLVAPGEVLKMALFGAVGACGTGWYPIIKAQLYAALPGRSGAALALANVTGFVGSVAPLALGLFAQRFGLAAAMWLLLLCPLALTLALPRGTKNRAPC
jgi:FSR family fosmidomycin resistance protein-like MFS transporter